MITLVTSEFINELQRLTKKRKDGYSSCNTDIINFIRPLEIKSLFEHPVIWYQKENWRFIKTYLKNSGQNLSGKNGFRFIYACNIKESLLVLLYIFPKRGKYSKTNLTAKEKKNLIISFFNQLDENKLIKFDLEKQTII